MPLLVEHYQAHKRSDKNLTLIGFFYEHYINNNASDPDYKADMQLPFKTHNPYIAVNLASARCVQPNEYDWLNTNIFDAFETSYPRYNPMGISSIYLTNIWQPPKMS